MEIIKGTSNNSFATKFSEFFIDNEILCSTIGIMQGKLKQYMENSENPVGTKITNNLAALKFFSIAMAIQKNLCLAPCSFSLFFVRNELLEVPLR